MIPAFQFSIAARTVWGEARGEGPAGIAAVAHVLQNRVKDGRWGFSLFDVCLAPWQFSCWNKADPNRALMLSLQDDDPDLQKCMAAVIAAYSPSNADPTGNATHYFADTISTPTWAKGLKPTAKIGHHLFFAGVR